MKQPTITAEIIRLHALIQQMELIGAWGLVEDMRKIIRRIFDEKNQ